MEVFQNVYGGNVAQTGIPSQLFFLCVLENGEQGGHGSDSEFGCIYEKSIDIGSLEIFDRAEERNLTRLIGIVGFVRRIWRSKGFVMWERHEFCLDE